MSFQLSLVSVNVRSSAMMCATSLPWASALVTKADEFAAFVPAPKVTPAPAVDVT